MLWLIFTCLCYFSEEVLTLNSPRVIGGESVKKSEPVPYQISLQYNATVASDGPRHICGGSILAPDSVITAAHCIEGLNLTQLSILAGVTDLSDTTGTRAQVVDALVHEDYKLLQSNDIAILKISPPLELDGKRIDKIALGDTYVGSLRRVTLTGWGLRYPVKLPLVPNEVNFPNKLKRVELWTFDTQLCRLMGQTRVTKKEICARDVLQGACSGDSGGPLTLETDKGVTLVGIVSYGFIICTVTPEVYARVSEYKDWIESHI